MSLFAKGVGNSSPRGKSSRLADTSHVEVHWTMSGWATGTHEAATAALTSRMSQAMSSWMDTMGPLETA